MIEDEGHVPTAPAALMAAAVCAANFFLNLGRSTGRVFPDSGRIARARIAEKFRHAVEPRFVGERGIDHLRETAGSRRAHQRAGGDQIGEIERGNRVLLGMLDDRRGADRQVGAEFLDRRDILFEAGAVIDAHVLGLEPVAVGIGPWGLGAGGADIGHLRAAFDQQPRDQQFGALVARDGDPALYGHGGQGPANGADHRVFRGVDFRAFDVARAADRLEPGGRVPSAPTGAEPTTLRPALSNSRMLAV